MKNQVQTTTLNPGLFVFSKRQFRRNLRARVTLNIELILNSLIDFHTKVTQVHYVRSRSLKVYRICKSKALCVSSILTINLHFIQYMQFREQPSVLLIFFCDLLFICFCCFFLFVYLFVYYLYSML
jgi:hypothetical protein